MTLSRSVQRRSFAKFRFWDWENIEPTYLPCQNKPTLVLALLYLTFYLSVSRRVSSFVHWTWDLESGSQNILRPRRIDYINLNKHLWYLSIHTVRAATVLHRLAGRASRMRTSRLDRMVLRSTERNPTELWTTTMTLSRVNGDGLVDWDGHCSCLRTEAPLGTCINSALDPWTCRIT